MRLEVLGFNLGPLLVSLCALLWPIILLGLLFLIIYGAVYLAVRRALKEHQASPQAESEKPGGATRASQG